MSRDISFAALVIESSLLTSLDTGDGLVAVKEAHPFVVLSLAILDDEVMTLVVRIDG